MKNNKNELQFNKLFNSVRTYRNVSLKAACYGLCSESMMYYIESGERLPGYQLRNRIMARLGISSEEYEDFLQYDEYDRWLECQKLINAVETLDVKSADRLIESLLTSLEPDNIVELQFLLEIQGRIMELKEVAWENIMQKYEEAVNATMPNIDLLNIKNYLLSPEEYYVVLRYIHARGKIKKLTDKNYLVQAFKDICDSISCSYFQDYALSKVYPMAVCYWYEYVKDDASLLSDSSIILWKNSEKALNSLRNAERHYYISDLLNARKELRGILSQNDFVESSKDKELEKSFSDAFNYLYSTFNIDPSMNYACYIYNGSQINCIADVIRSRRLLYGFTQQQLADGICSVKTIRRIEKKQMRPQQFVVKQLFEKLGVATDYNRAAIITNNYADIQLYNNLTQELTNNNLQAAYYLLQVLHNKLNLENIWNRQSIAVYINLMKYKIGVIEKKLFLTNMEKLLLFTLPKQPIYNDDCYLSEIEIMALYNISLIDENSKYHKMLVSKCTTYYKSQSKNFSSIYELIMGNEASRLGNIAKYTTSDEISIFIIIEALRNGRSHSIHRNLFNIAWNSAKNNSDYFNMKYDLLLKYSACLAYYSNDSAIGDFCHQKHLDFLNNIDWTL